MDEAELTSILAPDEVACLDAAFGLNGHSLWEHGQHVLRRKAKSDVESKRLARRASQTPNLARRGERSRQTRPRRQGADFWNALAAIALAKAARRLPDGSLAPALRLGRYLRTTARVPHRPDLLRRTHHADGGPMHEGFAEDYAFTVEAFLELHQSTQDRVWLQEARALMATAMERLFDPESNTFWNNAVDSDTPFVRSRSMEDGVIPSANASFASSLWKLGWALDIEHGANSRATWCKPGWLGPPRWPNLELGARAFGPNRGLRHRRGRRGL